MLGFASLIYAIMSRVPDVLEGRLYVVVYLKSFSKIKYSYLRFLRVLTEDDMIRNTDHNLQSRITKTN